MFEPKTLMTEKKPTVAACIPAFNEEATIARVVLLAERYVDRVFVCDDGSSDMTGNIAEALGAVVIRHTTNLGYGASLQSLFKEAHNGGVNMVVTLDADGQHDPSEIPKLLQRLSAGDVDIVVGSRFLEGGSSAAPAWRRAGIQVITDIVADGGVKITDAQSGFRAYTRYALESLSLTEEGMGLSTEILIKAGEKGLRIAEVPINVAYDGKSSTRNPVPHGLDLVFTTLKHISIRHPLLFYGVPGFASSIIALVFWILTLQIFDTTREIEPYIVLIAVGATAVGLMLMTTSIILWVIINVVREKP
jgi:glycosyltransferase involved in cell wall biosynthesis